ncbi:MAG: tetratricopeptide repeat protein [Bryobacteraceae bacterium]|nr:tetratricopeptide repeat protein [Bryobacteraceae bacterium]
MVSLTFAVFAAGSASFLLAGQSDGLKQPPAIPPSAAVSGEAQPRSANTTSEMRGDALMDRKNYQEAIATYQDAVRDQAILMNKIGIAYHQLTDLDTAKRYYERALQINPNYSEAINNLGTVYYAKKDYGKAEREYKKALKLTPESASIYSNLGTAYFARKRYDDAMQAYQKALSLDPEVFEHRSSAGVLLQERSVAERAKFHFYMAKTYAKAGVFDRALLYMRRALEEGFTERDRFRQDPEFAQMQEMPEFQQLLLLEPRVL